MWGRVVAAAVLASHQMVGACLGGCSIEMEDGLGSREWRVSGDATRVSGHVTRPETRAAESGVSRVASCFGAGRDTQGRDTQGLDTQGRRDTQGQRVSRPASRRTRGA